MESKEKLLWRAVIMILALSLYSNVAQGQSGSDRPGQDYKNFDLAQANPDLCKKACDDDPSCKSWTYVRPGFQGANARCWLKSGVPRSVKNDCCISGIKRAIVSDTTIETVTGPVMNAGQVRSAIGCIDWNNPPPGIVFGLKHSSNQSDKKFVWNGGVYDPSYQPKDYDTQPTPTQLPRPQSAMTVQNGGDSGGSWGEGFYWYETSGAGFAFPNTALNNSQELQAWRAFLNKFPPGLVLGLRHSINQPGKSLRWLSEPAEFRPWQFTQLDPVNQQQLVPWPFVRQNGGDRSGSSGQGFYWFEVSADTQPAACDASLPGGLVFGLKHSMNQPGKRFRWHGVEYDVAQRGGPVPPGFVRCHGGDLGAPSGQGYSWFETIGHGASVQNRLGVSCEASYRMPF